MKKDLGPNEYIQEIVSGGHKTYTYKTANVRTQETKTVCKVRGITINYATAQVVNFKSMWDLILGADDKEAITFHTERKITQIIRKCYGGIVVPEYGDDGESILTSGDYFYYDSTVSCKNSVQ